MRRQKSFRIFVIAKEGYPPELETDYKPSNKT
nr:MAG TPA_asm: hypothetical protein [Caudoviricetes sp.]